MLDIPHTYGLRLGDKQQLSSLTKVTLNDGKKCQSPKGDHAILWKKEYREAKKIKKYIYTSLYDSTTRPFIHY